MSSFTLEEIRFIEQFHDLMTPEQIGKKLGRPPYAIKRRILSLRNIEVQPRVQKAWTEEEENILRENYARKTAKQIAKMLGRTSASVQNRASSMGLKHDEAWMRTQHTKALAKWRASADAMTMQLLEDVGEDMRTEEQMAAAEEAGRTANELGLTDRERMYMQVVNLSVKGRGERYVADCMGWTLGKLKKYKKINNIVI